MLTPNYNKQWLETERSFPTVSFPLPLPIAPLHFSHYHVGQKTSINYCIVCSLPIHKICALCAIDSVISVLLTTANSDDLETRNSHQ